MPAAVSPPLSDRSPSPLATALPTGKFDASLLNQASKILHIISKYWLRRDDSTNEGGNGGLNFLADIYDKVAAGEVIQMCLPAFPFKSPSDVWKVLGRLPDKAKEFALAHLNGLCAGVKDTYTPGAKLKIISDGLVYNDLLGVPDKDAWAYGEGLRALAAEKNFSHIDFSRLKDLVHINVPDELDEMTYAANATNFRHALLQQLSRADSTTRVPCLRFHEPWPQSKTKFDATNILIENPGLAHTSEAICEAITEILHDRRVAFYHTWETGDLLVSDNVLAIHTRSNFQAGCDRELWRIHFD